jgi:quinol monooxygenase YgiN
MLVINGTFEIDPDHRDAIVAAAIEVQQASRKEEGCLHYVWSADLEDPNRLHIAEKWVSQEALDHHFTLPHVAAFLAVTKGKIRGSSAVKYEIAAEGPVR